MVEELRKRGDGELASPDGAQGVRLPSPVSCEASWRAVPVLRASLFCDI